MSNNKIYTKFGDQGQTRLVDGSCVEKHNPRVEAYGTVDELNSSLGLVIHSLQSLVHQPHFSNDSKEDQEVLNVLFRVQNHLFRIGSLLACSDAEIQKKLPAIEESHILFLENEIDQKSATLPVLKNFILPGGTLASSHLHLARTICRRAERRSSEMISLENPHESHALIYLNRLSDYLFVLSRWVNFKNQTADVLWNKDI
jgi:cob(I)alamin adenosyltransferase